MGRIMKDDDCLAKNTENNIVTAGSRTVLITGKKYESLR